MRWVRALVAWWRRQQRKTDWRFLLPALVSKAPSRHKAVEMMSFHIAIDPAWRDASEAEKSDAISWCFNAPKWKEPR